MDYTKELPTIKGWYWFRMSGKTKPQESGPAQLVYVYFVDGRLRTSPPVQLIFQEVEWRGPMPK